MVPRKADGLLKHLLQPLHIYNRLISGASTPLKGQTFDVMSAAYSRFCMHRHCSTHCSSSGTTAATTIQPSAWSPCCVSSLMTSSSRPANLHQVCFLSAMFFTLHDCVVLSGAVYFSAVYFT